MNVATLNRHAVILLCMAMTLAPSVYAQEQQAGPPPALVEVDDVRHEVISEQIWVPGTVISRADAELAAEVEGRITWLADVGDIVAKGEVLAAIDDTRLKLSLKQEEAVIARWSASVSMLSKRVTRFESMVSNNNLSQNDMEATTAELEIARQELAQAEARKALVEYQVNRSEVRAPFNAVVVSRLQSEGEYIQVGQTLLQVVDPNRVDVTVRAPLSVIPYIESGMKVAISDERRTREEAIRAIVPVGNARSRMMEIRVGLNPGDFAIGGAVRVALPNSESHQGVTVPRDALVLRKSGAFVYQVDENNEARQVAVTTGIGMGDRIEVFGDIARESPVITRGAERLTAGQKVRFSDEQSSLTARTP
ncbi:efflux RND transporter periplasmic adaptor subunit [Alteromonas halophila]|uniref:Hemolysin D n=1 Tax=Alteromonas halophila TaxID=516698 RepID=A0A918N1B7_9ALTE|nr:efflux RND transporter periplasmic adaptor subunit [Alteromonas halophila]GGW93610.1 hemolysin D [Alteromonas halophila]